MASWNPVRGPLADLSCVSRTYAGEICSPLACQQITGSYMLQIGVIGGLRAVWLSRRERKSRKAEAVDRRAKRRAEMNKATCVPVACVFVCCGCGRVCRSRIGLFSHERKCLSQLRWSWTWSDDCLVVLLLKTTAFLPHNLPVIICCI